VYEPSGADYEIDGLDEILHLLEIK
jgi:hypothetical protein